jgi:hypothetical protein
MYFLEVEIFEYIIQIPSEILLYRLPHDLFFLFNVAWYIIIEEMADVG